MDPLAKRIARRFVAGQQLDEKMKALLLKLRKGADASLTQRALFKVLALLGGWRVEEIIGLVPMHYTWEPPTRHFDTIYFDIWPNISTDNLKGIHRLHRRFKPALRAKGWMESWMREDLEEGWF